MTNAQSTHLTAKNLALGAGGAAYVDGYHANFINPANLMLGEGDSPRFMIGIIGNVSVNSGGSLANINVYNRYFTGGLTVTGDVADRALTQWFGTDPSETRYLGLQTNVIPIGLSYRSDSWGMGLSLRSRVLANTSLNKGLAQLGILGFDSDVFAEGQAVNFSAEALGFYEASLGFSFKLLEFENLFGFARNVKIYAGAAPKWLLGFHSSTIDFNSNLRLRGSSENEIDEIHHDFEYSVETAGGLSDQLNAFYRARQSQENLPNFNDYIDPQVEDIYNVRSSGIGLDLGGTAEMDVEVPIIGDLSRGPEQLKIGLSLTDLGKLTFDEESARFGSRDSLIWKGFEFDQQKIDEVFGGDRDEYVNSVLQDSIASEIYGSYAPQNSSGVGQRLPTMLSLGSQLTLNRWNISFDLMKGFNNNGVNSRRLALSTGLSYDLLGFLPLRLGMRTGCYSSTAYSAGFGLEFKNFEFSVAASTVTNSRSYGSSAAVAWSGLVFKF